MHVSDLLCIRRWLRAGVQTGLELVVVVRRMETRCGGGGGVKVSYAKQTNERDRRSSQRSGLLIFHL